MSAASPNDEPRRCPTCGKRTLVERVIRDEFEYGQDGEQRNIVVENVPVVACTNCGETLFGPEAARVRHEAICRTLGLLTPDEIKAIRDGLGKSQAELSQLMGIGVATLSRWERGRLIQSRALDRYLRVLQSVPSAVRFLQSVAVPTPGAPSA